jgi:hypothetical protein
MQTAPERLAAAAAAAAAVGAMRMCACAMKNLRLCSAVFLEAVPSVLTAAAAAAAAAAGATRRPVWDMHSHLTMFCSLLQQCLKFLLLLLLLPLLQALRRGLCGLCRVSRPGAGGRQDHRLLVDGQGHV